MMQPFFSQQNSASRRIFLLLGILGLLGLACVVGANPPTPLPATATIEVEQPASRVPVLPSPTIPTATPLPSPTQTAVPTPTLMPPPLASRTPVPTLAQISLPGGDGLVLPLRRVSFRTLFPRLKGEVHLFVAANGSAELLPLTNGMRAYNKALDVSPDGSRVLLASYDDPKLADLYVVAVDASAPVLLPLTYRVDLDPGAHFLTNEWVAFVAEQKGQRALYAVSWLTLEQRRISPEGQNVAQLVDTPGSDLFLFWKTGEIRQDGRLVYREFSGAGWGTLDGAQAEPFSSASIYPSPDGLTILVAEADAARQTVNFLLTGPLGGSSVVLPLPQAEPSAAFGYQFSWSPDSSKLLVSGFDQQQGAQRYLYIYSLTDNSLTTLPAEVSFQVDGGEKAIYLPQATWSPDAQHIAITNGCRLLVFDVATLEVKQQNLPCGTLLVFISGLLWAPDNQTLLLDRGSAPQVLDVDSMQLEQLLPLPSYPERYPDLTAGIFWVRP